MTNTHYAEVLQDKKKIGYKRKTDKITDWIIWSNLQKNKAAIKKKVNKEIQVRNIYLIIFEKIILISTRKYSLIYLNISSLYL